MKPLILLTNDDGIDSPGIALLFSVVKEIADVLIVAPDSERSGAGTSFNYLTPISIREAKWEGAVAWRADGSPTDCVKLGISRFAERRPDLVLSGVNHGSNAGRTALYSGTVGAAIDGAIRNIPSIAFSSVREEEDLSYVKPYILPVVQKVLETGLPKGTLLNVNFPFDAEIKGFRLARQGKSYWADTPAAIDESSYQLCGEWTHREKDPATDVSLLLDGYATIAPIHIGDLTDKTFLAEQKQAFNALRAATD